MNLILLAGQDDINIVELMSSAYPISCATVIGGGLAGSEAAFQLLRAGLRVDLIESRPAVQSAAHHSYLLGELVCSNSLRSDAEDTAPGLLKQEMRRVGSLIMQQADIHCVPAGSALAVDRRAFSYGLTAKLLAHEHLRLQRYAPASLPERPTILASGPLTGGALARHISKLLGEGFYFYDSIAPIIDAETIDWSQVFRSARRDPESQDYVNCPLDRQQYDRLVHELRTATQVTPHNFEEPRYFEGCLPVEVMALRGEDVLAHGPLRPVGLVDPRTGRRPYAVVQLRAENDEQTCFNLVGFQTRLIQAEQRRVFRLIPGLAAAKFLRYGSIHRNSFIDSPRLVDEQLRLKIAPQVRLAGQLAGVEGYLESTALGLVAGLLLAAELKNFSLPLPPVTTALGALARHVSRPRAKGEHFEPSNITFGLLPQPTGKVRDKQQRRRQVREVAQAELGPWLELVEKMIASSVKGIEP